MKDEIDIAIDEAFGEGKAEPYDLSEHFWLAKPAYSKEFAEDVIERFEDHLEDFEGSPVGQAIWAFYCAYHNLDAVGASPTTSITEAGESGELLAMRVNHVRGLIQHRLAMVTAERTALFTCARTVTSVPASARMAPEPFRSSRVSTENRVMRTTRLAGIPVS